MVRSCDVVIGQYGNFCYWSIHQCQVNDRLALMSFSCPVVGCFTIITNVKSIFFNHDFPEGRIPQHLASWLPLYAMGIKISCEDSANLPKAILPVQHT
jgi:hypothetical protein